jgi:hypothetical protein
VAVTIISLDARAGKLANLVNALSEVSNITINSVKFNKAFLEVEAQALNDAKSELIDPINFAGVKLEAPIQIDDGITDHPEDFKK